MSPDSKTVERIRLLKPSAELYVAVGLLIVAIAVVIGLSCRTYGIALFWSLIFGFGPLGLVPLICSALAQRAEQRQVGPGTWYVIDVEREKNRYGPLRAHRLFGHPIGDQRSNNADSW
ncbi:MAG: hypothetical protein AAF545_06060 [Pseudomonadota bacterium]